MSKIVNRELACCPNCTNIFTIDSIDPTYVELLAKHEKVLEMLRIAEVSLKTAHEYACSCCDSTRNVKSHCNKALEEIERMKNDTARTI